jgi:NAD(P)-dependent dehydrogenase (short-subunit alcohol dehydrogenase family)
MKTALIIGDSGAVGAAVAARLRGRGVAVTGLSRSRGGFDMLDEEAAGARLRALNGPFDLVFVASGGLEIGGVGPERALRDISAEAMAAQFALNAIGPALVLREAQHLLPRRGRSVFAVLSARVGSIGDNRLGGWVSYRASKAALNQVVRTASVELARVRPDAICVALHPGTVRSALTEKYLGRHPFVEPDVAAERLVSVIDGLEPAHSGGFYDWAGKEVPW